MKPLCLALLLLAASLPAGAAPDFTECYGSHFQQCFDFYGVPGLAPVPLVVLVHPGAWWTGDKAQGRPPLAAAHFQSRGYAAASINYRYTVQLGHPTPVTPMPAQARDVTEAVNHILLHASEPRFNVDPDRVFLWGMSGGGYLVSASALRYGLAPRGVVDLFGPTTFGYRLWGGELAWDQDLIDAGYPTYHGCNPGYSDPTGRPYCDNTHPGWFETSSDALSGLSALAGCPAGDPACPVDDLSLDDPAKWAVVDPPPFLIVHHKSDNRVALRQSERLAAALGPAADLQTFDGGHYYIPETDEPAIDAFLDGLVNWSVAGTGDFDGDGWNDVVWQDPATGTLRLWLLRDLAVAAVRPLQPETWGSRADPSKRVVAVADFDGDRKPDLLWRDRLTGELQIWLMDGTSRRGEIPTRPAGMPDPAWNLAAAGDLDADGRSDLFWRHASTGELRIWLAGAPGRFLAVTPSPGRELDPDWQVRSIGAFGGDSHADVLWRHRVTGALRVWRMRGASRVGVELAPRPAGPTDPDWSLAAVADFDRDGRPDWLWHRRASNSTGLWLFDGLERRGGDSISLPKAPTRP